MRRISTRTVLAALAAFILSVPAAQAVNTRDTRMLRAPAVSQDHIAFSYADDLWVADIDGKNARKVTSHQGIESAPYFSPDGSWIAFTGQYDGNTDVYVVPVEGGQPRRLTYHPSGDGVQGWTPDGKAVLFISSRQAYAVRHVQLYTVPVDGGMPTRLPLPHAYAGAFSPDGKYLVYRPHWEAFNQWKHYRGGTAARLMIYNTRDLTRKQIPQPEGRSNDTDPMWIGDQIYFRSDREGEFNLFSYDPRTERITQLTFHEDFPVVDASGGPGSIIYEQAGYLHLYEIAEDKTDRLKVAVASDLIEARPRYVKGTDYIRGADISPSAARAVFEFRGEIVTVPAKKGDPRFLSNTPGVHDRSPAWSPDGKHIAWFSDESGEYELVVASQDGKGDVRRLSLDGHGFYQNLTWSPDGEKLSYTDNSRTLYWIDLESGDTTIVGADAVYGPFQFLDHAWSPDSRWIAYNVNTPAYMNRVWIYSVESDESWPVSDGLSDALMPRWDKSGKYLYFFASTDAGPVQAWFAQSNADMEMTRAIYLAVLNKGEPSPLAKESDEEEAKDDEEGDGEEEQGEAQEEDSGEDDGDADGDDDDDDAEEEEEEELVVEIDFDGIDQRIVSLPVETAPLHALQAGAEGKVYYLKAPPGSNPFASDEGHELYVYDLNERKEEMLGEDVTAYALTPSGEKMLYFSGEDFFIADAAEIENDKGKLKIGAIQVRIDPREEWEQIFQEAWRINRDFFYDPDMHGADWPAMRRKYSQFLPDLASRSDLNRVIRWMCSELAVGHHGVGGGDRAREADEVGGGLLGVDYAVDRGRYQFAKVYGGLNWNPELRSPATEPGVDIAEGEYLLAVNGVDLQPPDNVYERFENTADRIVEITVGPNADGSDSRTVEVVPVSSEGALRRRAWVEGNLKYVEEATDGRVAYVHVPNTAGAGHAAFKRYFYPQSAKKAIIVDDRHNSGGSIADYYIDILRRPYVAHWAMRYGPDLETPIGAIQGPKVMLIDENAGSGGDLLPWMFRKFELGPLIGRRTWGGLVGVLGFPVLMDGGFVSAPNLGFWTEEGFIVESEGVPPDIEVELEPADWVEGKDTQLDKAIEVVLRMLAEEPVVEPKRPAFPVRAR